MIRSALESDPHSQQGGQVALAGRSGLFHWGNRSWRSGFDRRSHSRNCWGCWSTATGSASVSGCAAGVAVSIDDIISAQAKSLFGLATNTTIAITQGTGQSSNNFGAAAAVLANLITNLVSGCRTNSFISIVQAIDESRHDFRIADAIISIAEFAKSCTSLSRIAGGL